MSNRETTQTLAKAKEEPFGEALERAIRMEFPNLATFASAMGVSAGRVSQLISGREMPSAQTLGRIVRTFTSWAQQERIQSAWTRETLLQQTLGQDCDGRQDVIHQLRQLIDQGNPTRALAIARSLRERVTTPELDWQKVSEEMIEAYLKLSEPGNALNILNEMELRAKHSNNQALQITCLWMKGSVLRSMDHRDIGLLNTVHHDALTLTLNWRPDTPDEKVLRIHRKAALFRDHACNILHAVGDTGITREIYLVATESIQRSVEIDPGSDSQIFGLQTQVRLEIAVGNIFKAEEYLAQLDQIQSTYRGLSNMKFSQLLGHILIARNQRDEAMDLLRKTSQLAQSSMNFHLQYRLQKRLAQLELR